MEDTSNKNIKTDNEIGTTEICEKIIHNSYELENKVYEPINTLRHLIEHLKDIRTNYGMLNREQTADKIFDKTILEIDKMLDKLKYDKKGVLIRDYTNQIHAYIRGLKDR